MKLCQDHKRSISISLPPSIKYLPLLVRKENINANHTTCDQSQAPDHTLLDPFHLSLSLSATMCPSRRDPTTILAELSPDLRPAFDVLDSDHDGRISLTDLKRFYSDLAMSAPISDEEIAAMISTADSDQNGFVDFDEFEGVLTQLKRENSALMEVFGLMDRDGDGKVGFEDLKAHLQMIGMRVGDEEVKAMIEMAGGELNGGVSFVGLEKLLHGGF